MERLSIILVFMIWLSWTPSATEADPWKLWLSAAALILLAAVIVGFARYAREVARRTAGPHFYRDISQFSRASRLIRLLVPTWFAGLVFGLDFPLFVRQWIGPVSRATEAPGFVVGLLPAVFAWVGLWWAAYPAERAIREQSLLERLEANLPIRTGPTLWQYLLSNLRLQLLFLLAPVLCILVLRDLLVMGLVLTGIPLGEGHQLLISLGSMLPVLFISPLLLTRILPTAPIPPSPLRDRLMALCHRNRLQVSDILIWKTGGNLGNAAVMGILPRCRYLLVTDLLLETLSEEQILAAFAHEIGHIRHHHLPWMAACAFALLFAVAGPIELALALIHRHFFIPQALVPVLALGITALLFYVVMGLVIRRFERQADVFAARSLPHLLDDEAPGRADPLPLAVVEPRGAELVIGALRRVALVNNVSLHANEWLHGSIAWRIAFLRRAGEDPARTRQFDRLMGRINLLIILLLGLSGGWTLWNSL